MAKFNRKFGGHMDVSQLGLRKTGIVWSEVAANCETCHLRRNLENVNQWDPLYTPVQKPN